MWQCKNSKERARLKENGGQMKKQVEDIRELKTGRLQTDQIQVIQIYNAMTFLKVYEFFSLSSGQFWMFLQLDVCRGLLWKG